MDRALNSGQVREILGICRTTLYVLDKEGVLRARKMRGNRLYYLESDVMGYLNSLPYHRCGVNGSEAIICKSGVQKKYELGI